MPIKWDKQSERDMRKAFRQSIEIEKRSVPETLTFFAIRTAMSARSRTKRGKKFRDVINNPEWQKGSKKSKYAIVVKRQNKPDVLLSKRTRKKKGDSRVLISRKGLAKGSWGWMLSALGRNKGRTAKNSRKFIKVQKLFQQITPKIILENQLTYIDKIRPGIVREATQSALNYILKRQQQKLEKKLQRQFNRQ